MVCQRLLKVLGFATLMCLVHADWKAIRTVTKVETFCSDVNRYITWTLPNNNDCNTNLQQVFKLLYRSDTRILIGSTECLYFLDQNLGYIHSISIPAKDLIDCNTTFGDQAEFQCKNYITYAHPIGSSYRVCGTYNKIDPKCWICDETMPNCEKETVVNFMPRYPTSNFTVTVASK
ncbi:uncharacterized protein LOC129262125 [Lytechinus pictus]|uniref:uncharacterized protein LOC129262125 n=1 Tax=Lytechinus pictus TaxID=7653 RepID=UPI0030B9C1C7